MDLHEQIRIERERQNITKYRLAHEIKMAESYYGELEAGKKEISRKTIEKVCKVLSISITIHPDKSTTIKRVKSK